MVLSVFLVIDIWGSHTSDYEECCHLRCVHVCTRKMGCGGITPLVLDLGITWMWEGYSYPSPFTWGQNPLCLWNRKLDGLQNHSWPFGEEKYLFLLPGIKIWFCGCASYSPVILICYPGCSVTSYSLVGLNWHFKGTHCLFLTFKMEAAHTSKTYLFFCQTTQCHISEDSIPHTSVVNLPDIYLVFYLCFWMQCYPSFFARYFYTMSDYFHNEATVPCVCFFQRQWVLLLNNGKP